MNCGASDGVLSQIINDGTWSQIRFQASNVTIGKVITNQVGKALQL
jgi:hypothetical protein